MLGFLVSTVYVPGVTGAAINTGWVAIWLLIPVLLFTHKVPLKSVHMFGLSFMTYAALSLLWAPNGLFAFMQLAGLAGVFMLGSTTYRPRGVYIGLALGLAISDVISLTQRFGMTFIPSVTDFPSGLFINSNIFAETSGMLLIILIVNRLWFYVPVTLPGLVMTTSRTVIASLLFVFALWLWNQSKRWTIAAVIIVSPIFLWFIHIRGWSSLEQRFDIWRDTLSGLTLFGHGVGSFEYLYPHYATHLDILLSRPVQAHNDLLQGMFEFGIGFVPLMIMITQLLRIDDVNRYPIYCFLVLGVFGFPFHMPVSAFMAAFVAGQLSRRLPVFRFDSVLGRPLVPSGYEGVKRRAF